jgi:MFS family permease
MQKMPAGFYTLLCAQFFSSWADNALLIVAIADLTWRGESPWMIPMLKFGFTLSYVVLAPWVGASADGWKKSSIMWAAHALKVFGVWGIAVGLNPLVFYALVGMGAALYSPAKYGWMTQMVPAARLIHANGWIETATVCSAIGGVVCGGWWISASYLTSLSSLFPWLPFQPTGLSAAYLSVVLLFLVTVVLTFAVPPEPLQLGVNMKWHQRPRHFFKADWTLLWKDVQARTSLCITTLFWGVAACMQLLVLDWAKNGLDLSLEQGAYLQGLSGLGVVIGAWMAGRTVRLEDHHSVLVCGFLMGALLPLMWFIQDWAWSVPLILLMGVLGGLLVVPMNAMLQHRGKQVLTSGRSIAVQNFNENLSILLMLSLYALILQLQGSWVILVALFSLMMTIVTACFMRWPGRPPIKPAPSANDHPP